MPNSKRTLTAALGGAMAENLKEYWNENEHLIPPEITPDNLKDLVNKNGPVIAQAQFNATLCVLGISKK